MNYITVFPPILFTAALIYRNYLQSKINSTKYHNLIHECKNNYKSTSLVGRKKRMKSNKKRNGGLDNNFSDSFGFIIKSPNNA